MESAKTAGLAGGIVPSRLAARLAPGLAAVTAERLLASPSLGARVRRWAAEGTEDAVHALAFDDRMLAEGGAAGLRRAAMLAGAVWHARRVRGLMLARDLQAFIDQYGPAAREAALRHAALSPDAEDGGPVQPPLIEAVAMDGRACLSAWLDTLPPPAAAAIRLALPESDEAEPGPAHREHGPRILRAAAEAVT